MIGFIFLFRRECHRFMKVLVQTVLTPLISATLYLLVFGVSLGSQVEIHGAQYLAFLVPGLMMMGLMNNAFQNSSSSLVSSKFTGDIEDLAVVPLTRSQIIWAMSLASVVRGAMVALTTLLVGEAFYYFKYQSFIYPEHPLWLMYFILVGGLVFGQMGLMAAFWAKTFDQLSAVSTFVILPLTYLGGVFMSIESLPEIWRKLSLINPLFYFINGLRYSVLGFSDVDVTHASVLALVFLVLMHFLARRVLSRVSFSRW
ncbi:MAG: ABC transporter permease [Bdellovibrio sp. CG10_big_fil_rev_8_21_14_0_10_47_8]|nr:MAG: ABC transporter permease [Bdellovibrio sp. CG10_big_fil_rev_8_21_14_0_10_47_8]